MYKVIKFTDENNHVIYFDYNDIIQRLDYAGALNFRYVDNKDRTMCLEKTNVIVNSIQISANQILFDKRFEVLECLTDEEYVFLISNYNRAFDEKIQLYHDIKIRGHLSLNY